MRASANSVFRSGVNEDEKDLPVRQEKSASEGFNFAVKREDIVNKVVGLKKQPKKLERAHRLLVQNQGNRQRRENEATEHRARRLQVMK